MFQIVQGGLSDPRVVELLQTHLRRARAETAAGSAHALDRSGIRLSALWTSKSAGRIACGFMSTGSRCAMAGHFARIPWAMRL
jgi:hypothetical protein